MIFIIFTQFKVYNTVLTAAISRIYLSSANETIPIFSNSAVFDIYCIVSMNFLLQILEINAILGIPCQSKKTGMFAYWIWPIG